MPDVGQDAGQFANAASSNYGSALRLVQALRAAADQQKQRQDQQKLESFKNELEILKAGGSPLEATNDQGRPSLLQANRPELEKPGSTVTEPISGRQYRVPVPEKKEKEVLDDTNSFTLSGGVLNNLNAAGVQGGDKLRIPVKGNEGLLKSLSEAHGEKPMEFHTTGPDGATHVFERDPKSGKWTNVGNFEDTAKPAAAKAKHLRVDLEHFNVPVQIDEDTNEVTPLKLPAGVKSQLTPTQEETRERDKERREDRAKADEEKKQKEAEKRGESTQKAVLALNTKEQGEHEKRSKYGDILSQLGEIKQGDKGSIVDPDTKRAVVISDTNREGRRKYYQSLYQKATDMVGIYQAQQRQLMGQGGGQPSQPAGRAPAEPAASTTTAAPTQRSQGPTSRAPQPAAPGAVAPKKGAPPKGQKTATMAHIRAYAKQKGIGEAQAVREFKDSQYTIQGQ